MKKNKLQKLSRTTQLKKRVSLKNNLTLNKNIGLNQKTQNLYNNTKIAAFLKLSKDLISLKKSTRIDNHTRMKTTLIRELDIPKRLNKNY